MIARNAAVFLTFCAIAGAIYGYSQWQIETRGAEEARAKAAGFASHSSMQRATAAGISDPSAWAEREAKDAAEKQRRDQVEAAARAKADEERYERTRDPATKMSVKNFSWKVSGFGAVGVITVTVGNDNDFAIKDPTLTCSFYAPSGTQLSKIETTIFETIKPRSVRTFKDHNVGFIHSQSQRAGCQVGTARRT